MDMIFNSNFAQLMLWIISSIGCFALFKKDKIRPFYAFIPGVREYELSVMAEREEEGRTYLILTVCVYLGVFLAAFFYSFRIYSALCRVFNAKRIWVLFWVLAPAIPAVIWGFSKKRVPVHKSTSTDLEKAAAISGASVEAIEHGLTVNLTDRTAMVSMAIGAGLFASMEGNLQGKGRGQEGTPHWDAYHLLCCCPSYLSAVLMHDTGNHHHLCVFEDGG